MALWKRVAGWTGALRTRIADVQRDDEPQQLVFEQLVVGDALPKNDDGAVLEAAPAPVVDCLDGSVPAPAPVVNSPVPAPSGPATSYGGVSAGLTKYGLAAWYLIGIGLVVGFVIFATARVQMVFIAVFVAFVLTSLLNPVIRLLSRWMPRAVATTISLLATFVFFGGLLFYVG